MKNDTDALQIILVKYGLKKSIPNDVRSIFLQDQKKVYKNILNTINDSEKVNQEVVYLKLKDNMSEYSTNCEKVYDEQINNVPYFIFNFNNWSVNDKLITIFSPILSILGIIILILLERQITLTTLILISLIIVGYISCILYRFYQKNQYIKKYNFID